MNVDGVLVVNLDARPERWKLFQAGNANWKSAFGQEPMRLSAVAGTALSGFGDPPWFRGRITERRRNSWAGKAGCMLSHRNAIEHALKQGWGNVLIVEDDAFIADEKVQAWKSWLSSMVTSLPEDWAVVYLYTTANPITPCRVVSECNDEGSCLAEAVGAFGTVAYLLNGRVFEQVLAGLPVEKNIWPWVACYKAIDLWFFRNLRRFGKVYAIVSSLVGHQVGRRILP